MYKGIFAETNRVYSTSRTGWPATSWAIGEAAQCGKIVGGVGEVTPATSTLQDLPLVLEYLAPQFSPVSTVWIGAVHGGTVVLRNGVVREVIAARDLGFARAVVPKGSGAVYVDGIDVVMVGSIKEAIALAEALDSYNTTSVKPSRQNVKLLGEPAQDAESFSASVSPKVRRALQIAIAGGHSLLIKTYDHTISSALEEIDCLMPATNRFEREAILEDQDMVRAIRAPFNAARPVVVPLLRSEVMGAAHGVVVLPNLTSLDAARVNEITAQSQKKYFTVVGITPILKSSGLDLGFSMTVLDDDDDSSGTSIEAIDSVEDMRAKIAQAWHILIGLSRPVDTATVIAALDNRTYASATDFREAELYHVR